MAPSADYPPRPNDGQRTVHTTRTSIGRDSEGSNPVRQSMFRRIPLIMQNEAERTGNQHQHCVPNPAFVFRDICDRSQILLVQACFDDGPGETTCQ